MWTDSHCHLQGETDPAGVIATAGEAGVTRLVCVGTDAATTRQAIGLAAAHEGVWATAGLHPHDATQGLESVVPLVSAPGVVAVGECGLDYHYDNSPRESQRVAFAAQIALAAETNKPLVVHTRDAEDDTRAMIDDARTAGATGVLHCYTGTPALAEFAIDAGWYISFSGIITFKKWTDDDLLRVVPSNRLLVESDSPYLAPVPFRGKRNEPAWVSHTIEKLAAARADDAGHLGRITAANAERLFGLALEAA